MTSEALQNKLYKLKKYITRGYAEAVYERLKKKEHKISKHIIYKVAAGKVYHPAVLEELIAFATEKKHEMKAFEKRINELLITDFTD